MTPHENSLPSSESRTRSGTLWRLRTPSLAPIKYQTGGFSKTLLRLFKIF